VYNNIEHSDHQGNFKGVWKMLQKYRFAIFILLLISINWLTGCSSAENKPSHQHAKQPAIPQSLTIQFQTNPAQVEPNQSLQLISNVKRGNQPATDAKVEFEVWTKGQKSHQRLTAKHAGNGKYVASSNYKQTGRYSVMVHVNAPGVHQMISGQFQVGEPNQHEHSSHHSHALTIHMMLPESAQKGKATTLTGHVQKEDQPFGQANVQFEIWQEGKEKHEFIPAKESKPGEYTASHTFSESGTYHIQIHIEKGEIHEHKEEQITVK
jgi:YtkA-like